MNKIGHVRPNIYLMSLVACIIGLGCYFLMFKALGVSVPPWVKGPGSILVFTYFISLIFIHELIHIIVIKAQNWKYLSSPTKRLNEQNQTLWGQVSVCSVFQLFSWVYPIVLLRACETVDGDIFKARAQNERIELVLQ